MSSVLAQALVSYEPNGGDMDLRFEDVSIRDLKDDELLIRLVATGICHTDLVFGSLPSPFTTYPKVLGHEDPDTFLDSNGQKICGLFFGQSSMASYTIAKQASVVNVTSVIRNESELKLFAPLGCGFQTGFGAIDVVASAGPDDTVVVMGIGGVGFSAIAGAKLNQCNTIIAVDRVPQRLQLAREFGATHVIDSSETQDLVAEVKALTKGRGSSITLDTTGNMKLIENGLAMTANRGQMIIVGVPPMDAQLGVHLVSFMQVGNSSSRPLRAQFAEQ
ncbi:hypothetical protein LTS17_006272 [Exophiala oligosperma]